MEYFHLANLHVLLLLLLDESLVSFLYFQENRNYLIKSFADERVPVHDRCGFRLAAGVHVFRRRKPSEIE